MLPWSVIATAGMFRFFTRGISSAILFAPSNNEYCVWRWRCAKPIVVSSECGGAEVRRCGGVLELDRPAGSIGFLHQSLTDLTTRWPCRETLEQRAAQRFHAASRFIQRGKLILINVLPVARYVEAALNLGRGTNRVAKEPAELRVRAAV